MEEEEEECCDCVEAPGNSGDWICKEQLFEKLSCCIEEDEEECQIKPDQKETQNYPCFHQFDEHIKTVNSSSGDYFNKGRIDRLYNNANLNATNLSAFLCIGAEAERRREEKFQNMISDLEQVSKNNKLLCLDNQKKNCAIEALHRKLNENETLICNLKNDLNQYKQKYCELQKANSSLCALQNELQMLKVERAKLQKEVQELTYKYNEMQNVHNKCPSSQETRLHSNKLSHLNQLIDTANIELMKKKQEALSLNENNEMLQKRVWQLTNELKDMCHKQMEKNKLYNDTVFKLQTQIKNLSNDLSCVQEKLKQKGEEQEKLKSIIKNVFKQNNCAQNQRLEQLQQIINSQAKDIKCLEEINSVNTVQLQDECDILDGLISKQNRDIEVMMTQIKIASEEDVESVGLLNDMSQLNCEMNSRDSPKDSNNLLKRIIKIKSRVQARIQREQFKYERAVKELGLLRCQFAKMQKEIESLRASSNAECRDEIKTRIQKEQELSKAILRYEKSAEYSKSKLNPLHKTLQNIDKMRDVVRQINFF